MIEVAKEMVDHFDDGCIMIMFVEETVGGIAKWICADKY